MKKMADKDHRIAVLEKALELACYDSDNWFEEREALNNRMSLKEHFINQAEKELEGKNET